MLASAVLLDGNLVSNSQR